MDLIDQYRQMHAEGKFKGLSLLPHVDEIAKLVKETNSKTLLDYGCGKGEQYTIHKAHEKWGIMPDLYDPAVPEHGHFIWSFHHDGVICTDVMEHVPIEEIPHLLNRIFGWARRFVFLTICTRPARKTLPDGRNCHVTVRSEDWWMSMIGERDVRYKVIFT